MRRCDDHTGQLGTGLLPMERTRHRVVEAHEENELTRDMLTRGTLGIESRNELDRLDILDRQIILASNG